MNKKIIAANFKMNKTPAETQNYFNVFLELLGEEKFVDLNNKDKNKNSRKKLNLINSEIIFAPSFTSLLETYNRIKNYDGSVKIKLASQNVYYEKSGAYTGEISIRMIKECGCSYAIVGHSERRCIFNETDEMIGKKIKAVYDDSRNNNPDNHNNYNNDNNYNNNINAGVIPILCVGENLQTRKKGMESGFVSNQLDKALISLKARNIPALIVAYEPLWAIGTGVPIAPEDGETMHRFIYEHLNKNYKIEELRILYGGSVTETNIKPLVKKEHIDGVLVGGASLDPVVFFDIFKSFV